MNAAIENQRNHWFEHSTYDFKHPNINAKIDSKLIKLWFQASRTMISIFLPFLSASVCMLSELKRSEHFPPGGTFLLYDLLVSIPAEMWRQEKRNIRRPTDSNGSHDVHSWLFQTTLTKWRDGPGPELTAPATPSSPPTLCSAPPGHHSHQLIIFLQLNLQTSNICSQYNGSIQKMC